LSKLEDTVSTINKQGYDLDRMGYVNALIVPKLRASSERLKIRGSIPVYSSSVDF